MLSLASHLQMTALIEVRQRHEKKAGVGEEQIPFPMTTVSKKLLERRERDGPEVTSL